MKSELSLGVLAAVMVSMLVLTSPAFAQVVVIGTGEICREDPVRRQSICQTVICVEDPQAGVTRCTVLGGVRALGSVGVLEVKVTVECPVPGGVLIGTADIPDNLQPAVGDIVIDIKGRQCTITKVG